MCAEYLPVTWRSLLTGGCIETGTEVWNGGANYYTTAQIVVAGVDAANADGREGPGVRQEEAEHGRAEESAGSELRGIREVRKLCYEAPKHGNDIPEVNRMVRRVYDSMYQAFQNVDVGGNYISKDIKSAPDAYTKNIHNLMGLVTGACHGKYAGVALTDGSLSAMPGTDVHGPTALVMSAAKSQDAVKYTATHMNMKLPPDQLTTRKGRDNVLNLVKTYFDNEGYHIQFNVLDTAIFRDAQNIRKTTATSWFGRPFSAPSSSGCTLACRTR